VFISYLCSPTFILHRNNVLSHLTILCLCLPPPQPPASVVLRELGRLLIGGAGVRGSGGGDRSSGKRTSILGSFLDLHDRRRIWMVARKGKRTRGSMRGRRCTRKRSHHNHQLRAYPVLLLQATRRRPPLRRRRRLPPPHQAAPMRRVRLTARRTVGRRIVQRYRCIDVQRRSSISRATRSGTSVAAAQAARCCPALVVRSGVTGGRRLVCDTSVDQSRSRYCEAAGYE
jgi:hypothetical protein